MAQYEDQEAGHAQHDGGYDPSHQRPAPPTFSPRVQEWDQIVIDPRLLALAGVAPDEKCGTGGQEQRPGERSDEADAQGAGHELHDDKRGHDGNDQPDAPAIGDDPGKDVAGLPFERNQEPGQGVYQDTHTAAQGQEDEGDPDQGDIDPGGRGQSTTDPGQNPRVARSADRAAEMSVPAPATPPVSGPSPPPTPWPVVGPA